MGKKSSITFDNSLTTESGSTIPHPVVSYQTWGKLNENGDNAVLVCHALTGNTNADEWFGGLFGNGKTLDPAKQFIICPNVLGSCYGTTGPGSKDPKTRKKYRHNFPKVTVRDAVKLHQRLLDALNIRELELVIGGSLGGMQALEFTIMDNRAQKAILIGMGKAHRPWQIGISETQRQAIYNDPNWNDGFYDDSNPPEKGLAVARMIAMNSYRSPEDFDTKFAREHQDGSELFQVESYLNYQGQKLSTRFDAVSYVRLTQMMDSHDIARGRDTYQAALSNINTPVLVAGINSDRLYPAGEQKELARLFPSGSYAEITSPHGHDAFLIEFEKMNRLFTPFLEAEKTLSPPSQ